MRGDGEKERERVRSFMKNVIQFCSASQSTIRLQSEFDSLVFQKNFMRNFLSLHDNYDNI